MSLLGQDILEVNDTQMIINALRDVPLEQVPALYQAFVDTIGDYINVDNMAVCNLLTVYRNEIMDYVPYQVHYENDNVCICVRNIKHKIETIYKNVVDEWIFELLIKPKPLYSKEDFDTLIVGCFGMTWQAKPFFTNGDFRVEYKLSFTDTSIASNYDEYCKYISILMSSIK